MALYMQSEYRTFNDWMADAHSLIAHIQHEIDLAVLSGGGSEYLEADALSELVAMTESFSGLLELGDKLKQQAA